MALSLHLCHLCACKRLRTCEFNLAIYVDGNMCYVEYISKDRQSTKLRVKIKLLIARLREECESKRKMYCVVIHNCRAFGVQLRSVCLMPTLKVYSDQKRSTCWTPQEYIPNQCKRHNYTQCHFRRRKSRDTHNADHVMRCPSPHRLKLKKLNFSGNIAWRCVTTANQCWVSPDINEIPTVWTLPEFTKRTLNQT